MVAAVLFSLLFVIVISAFIFFTFSVLYPSLKAQNINVDSPIFSVQDLSAGRHILKRIDTGNPGFRAEVRNPKSSLPLPEFYGLNDCKLFHSVYENKNASVYGCLGFGDCVRKCPRGAIFISESKAVVDVRCNGCGLCVDECPQKLIKLVSDENIKISELPRKKDFSFWQKCYRILSTKKR